MLLPTFYLIFRAPSEKIGNIWMDAIELTLKSSHLLKPSSSLNATFQSQFISNKVNSNELHSLSNATITKLVQDSTELNSTHSDLKQNNIQNLSRIESTNKQTPQLSVRQKCTSSLTNQDIEIETKHFNEISDQHDETLQSDSDGAKNSSDDICSLNSSNNDEFGEYENDTNLENETESEILNETKYVLSPSEEFGEVRQISLTDSLSSK
jgi:hypothetical protein